MRQAVAGFESIRIYTGYIVPPYYDSIDRKITVGATRINAIDATRARRVLHHRHQDHCAVSPAIMRNGNLPGNYDIPDQRA